MHSPHKIQFEGIKLRCFGHIHKRSTTDLVRACDEIIIDDDMVEIRRGRDIPKKS